MIDGLMKVRDEALPALVYKASEDKDLALLKLTRLPAGVRTLPTVPLAKQNATPGMDCVAIGHPAAGMLWTVRSGEVAGIGNWPHEMIDVVMQRLALPVRDRDRAAALCAGAPKRRVVV